MNTSCGDTVKCRLDAGKSPIFQSQRPCTYIYTYRSRNGFGISYVYINVQKYERVKYASVNSASLTVSFPQLKYASVNVHHLQFPSIKA